MSLAIVSLEPLAWVLLAIAAAALLMFGVALLSTWRHLRQRPARSDALPPVSLLKPVKGLEDDLEANLRSFFEQDYPAPFEIVFCATEANDAGLQLARSLAKDYPHVPSRFVVSDARFGLNPKVSNLSGAVAVARYDLLHQSDANVRADRGYLRQIVGELVAADASMLTSVVVGTGERTVGAALENLQLSAYIAPAMCLALKAANITCVCGKSMLFRKSELERDIGGLGAVANVLCEDFVLGERYKALGKKVLLSPTTIANINRDCSPQRFLERHSRWLKMRITLHVPGFIADLLSNPIAVSALAVVVSGAEADVTVLAALAIALKTTMDQIALRLTRQPMAWRFVWLTPVKDLLLLPLWVNALCSRTVVWRGRRLKFGKNTQLIPLESEEPLADLADA